MSAVIGSCSWLLEYQSFSPAAGWRLHRSPGCPACWASVIPSPAPARGSYVPPPGCSHRRSARQRPPPAGRPPAGSAEAKLKDRDKEGWKGLITAFFVWSFQAARAAEDICLMQHVQRKEHRQDEKTQGLYRTEDKLFFSWKHDITSLRLASNLKMKYLWDSIPRLSRFQISKASLQHKKSTKKAADYIYSCIKTFTVADTAFNETVKVFFSFF